MRETRYNKHLASPPAAVSTFLADLRNDGKWRKEVIRTDLVSGCAGEAGATYTETLTWEGLRASSTLRVVAFEQGSRLVLVAEDPGYRATYEYAFTPANGGTELALVAGVETKGTMGLVEPFIWAMVTRWLDRGFDRLDDALKADSPSTS